MKTESISFGKQSKKSLLKLNQYKKIYSYQNIKKNA